MEVATESGEGKKSSEVLNMDSPPQTTLMKEIVDNANTIEECPTTAPEPDGKKMIPKDVHFLDDSIAQEEYNPVPEKGSKTLQGASKSQDQTDVNANHASSDVSTPRTRGRSERTGKQRSKRSQTPFQRRKIAIDNPDNDDDHDEDGTVKDGSRTNANAFASNASTNRGVNGGCSPFSYVQQIDLDGSRSTGVIGQTGGAVLKELGSESARDDTHQTVVKGSNSEMSHGTSEDRSHKSEQAPQPPANAIFVTKSPASTSVRFTESTSDVPEEQAANELTTKTNSEFTPKEIAFAEVKSPRGRQRTLNGKAGRRSQTPFNRHRIRADSDDDEQDLNDSQKQESIDMPATSASAAPPALQTTKQADLSNEDNSSFGPRVKFAMDAQSDRGASEESCSGMGSVSSLRFSETADRPASAEADARNSREASLEMHAVADESSRPVKSPRGRQPRPNRKPSRRSQTPFNRRLVSYSDEDEEANMSEHQSPLLAARICSSAENETKPQHRPGTGVPQKPRVTFAAELRTSNEKDTSGDAAVPQSQNETSVRFVEPAIARSNRKTGDFSGRGTIDDMGEGSVDVSFAVQSPRGRQRRSRKRGKRSQTPFSRHPVHVYTSEDDDDATGRGDPTSPFTPRPSSIKTASNADRVSMDEESRENSQGRSGRISYVDADGIHTRIYRKSNVSAWDDKNTDVGINQFSKDSDDIDAVCRSISRVTVASSQASEDIRLFHKGTQITPTCDVGTQTMIDDTQDSLHDSRRVLVRTTECRIKNPLVYVTEWFAGMFGKCY